MTSTRIKPFFCVLRVLLNEPITDLNRGASIEKPLIGYYRRVGVAAEDHSAAIQLYEGMVTDGKIDWAQSAFLAFEALEKEIAAKYCGHKGPGCWYSSGRALFPKE